MLRACSTRDQHFGGAMLQHLEAADGDAELLARFHVVDRGLVHGRHGADRLGAQRRDRLVGDALDQRKGGAGLAERGRRPSTRTSLSVTSAARRPSTVG